MFKKIISFFCIFIFIFGSFSVSAEILNNDCGCNNQKTFSSSSDEYALGWIDEESPYGISIPSSPEITSNTLSSWDWRNAEYKGVTGDWTTPIKDQGACGSCWAFGAVAALETLYNMKKGNPNLDIDLSEQFVVSCGMLYNPLALQGCCGGYLQDTLNFLGRHGTVTESCFGYQAIDANGRNFSECDRLTGSHDPVECDDKCSEWKNQVYKIGNYYSLLTKNMVKNAIVEYGPVISGIAIYEDFYDYENGIYERNSNNYLGGHIVAIVGFNDAEQYWICKNSWGDDWGENGYFRIRYGEAQIANPGSCAYVTQVSKETAKANFKPCDIVFKLSFVRILKDLPIFQNLLKQILI